MNNWLERICKGSRREKRVLTVAVVVAVLILLIDQITKWYFVKSFSIFESRPVISPILSFTYVRNTGAAWSLFDGHVWMLFAFGVLTATGIIFFFRKLAEGCSERYFALLMILAGIVGNSFDRAFYGSVVDFIHVHYRDVWSYPVFNVADMAICIGVTIYLISGFSRGKKED